MSYKIFCVCGLFLVCSIFIPSLWSNYQNYLQEFPSTFGCEADQAKYLEKNEQLSRIEDVKENASKYIKYA